MSWVRFFFSLQGRINRLQALLGLCGGAFVISAFSVVNMSVGPHMRGEVMVFESLRPSMIVPYAVGLVSQLTIFVRRAHDVGRSGWIVFWWAAIALCLNLFVATQSMTVYLALAIPMVLSGLWLQFSPGLPGANQFGEPPRPGWLP